MKTIISVLVCLTLWACAAGSNPFKTAEADRYRCENDVAFTVSFSANAEAQSATINSNRGYEVLYREMGGAGPTQTVYSNPRMRAEFGVSTNANQAVLRYLLQPVAVRCVRE